MTVVYVPSWLKKMGYTPTFCIIILGIFVYAAIFPKTISPYSPEIRFSPYGEPDENHMLGTDDMGYDILTLLIYATRISLIIGVFAGILSLCIGTSIGIASGFHQGWIDDLMMGVTDITLIIPKIPVIILIAAYLHPSIWILIIVLGLFSWETTARVVRAKTMQIRNSGFVLSSRCLGFSSFSIIIHDIIPVIYPVLLPKFMLTIAGAMISEASLSFLGLSDPMMESWGKMIADAFSHGGFIREMWWWFLPPAICICVTVLAITRIGMMYESNEPEMAFE